MLIPIQLGLDTHDIIKTDDNSSAAIGLALSFAWGHGENLDCSAQHFVGG